MVTSGYERKKLNSDWINHIVENKFVVRLGIQFNPMAFKFEQLRTWQLSMELAERVNELVDRFPPHERYYLSLQSRRSADSVALNIAEGSTGQSDPEQIKFLGYANRSALEVVTYLFKAKRRKYIDDSVFLDLYKEYEKLSKMIQAQIASLETPV